MRQQTLKESTLAQQVFNKWINLRDKGKPCISCDKPITGRVNASHFWNAPNRSGLVTDEEGNPVNPDTLTRDGVNSYITKPSSLGIFLKPIFSSIGISIIFFFTGNDKKVFVFLFFICFPFIG